MQNAPQKRVLSYPRSASLKIVGGVSPLVMVGAFPPPVVGLATTNAAVRDKLIGLGGEPQVINIAAPGLERSLLSRLARVPKVVRGLVHLASTRRLRGAALYISVSGGFGQVYDAVFIALARLRRMRIFIRHCSFAYLDEPTGVARLLTSLAGPSAIHVTQSQGMADRLEAVYGTLRVVPISNAVLYSHEPVDVRPRQNLGTLGFLSNISAEKGVFDFLDLVAAIEREGLPLNAKLAGPFQDRETERAVHVRLEKLPSVQYIGPVYGIDKDNFLASVDVLVFPTRYKDETEAKVNHEAMSRAIPVIAYGRGCIPEIVGSDSGRVIDPSEPFVPEALAQIEAWLADQTAFQLASQAAARRFSETYAQSQAHWQALLNDLVGGAIESRLQGESEDSSSHI